MPFVSITRLRVRRWRLLPQFLIQSIRIAGQAQRAVGSIAVSILRDADRAFWTQTVWRDESAMRAFMQSRRASPSYGGCRSGAMRPPSCIGGKTPRKRRLGRKRIAG
jgi:hypothetical protein